MKKTNVMNKKIFILIILILLNFCLAVEISPQNIFLDHYEIIPPLGKVKALATSINKLFAISDNYLLIFDKNTLQPIRTTYFNQEIFLLAYDQFYDELWISTVAGILRYNINLGSLREYRFAGTINRIGVTPESIYVSSQINYSLDRISGKFKPVAQLPEKIKWFKPFDDKELRTYKFLTPYFYQDNLNETNDPFHQYEITSFYEDGMELFIGTNQYGILKYNKVSLEKKRIIYGPLIARIQRLKKVGDTYYFVSSAGISYFKSPEEKSWQYFRTANEPGDFIFFNNELIVSFGNQLAKITGAVSIPITNFRNSILALSFDVGNIYIGTHNGMYRILKETSEPLDFGPDNYGVYVIYPTENQIFVGGEFATYRFDRSLKRWFQILPLGTKDICEIKNKFYLLTIDNQLIRYSPEFDSTPSENDTLAIVLPYFNIYDIDTDGDVLYCATGSGINYFDPKTQFYNPVYNLPRIKYNYVGIVYDDIIVLSDRLIYRLPLKYRD